MSIDEMRAVLVAVSHHGYRLEILADDGEAHPYMIGRYEEACVLTGVAATQATRKWRLSPHMTRSEIVQTALKLVLTSAEHRVREHFLYRGQRVYGPHFDVDGLYELAAQGALDKRRPVRVPWVP